MSTLFSLLVFLISTQKVQGGVDGALAFINGFVDEVLAGLPSDATDMLTPLVDALKGLLADNAEKFDLKAIAQEIIATLNKGLLGDTDDKAGGGM